MGSTKVVIISHGSIGKRHARLLAPMVSELAVVSSQEVPGYRYFPSLEQALELSPDYVVIANITAAHAASLSTLKSSGYGGKVLVEKPLFSTAAQNTAPYPFSVHVAYQLRFHRVIRAMMEALGDRKVLSAHIYVGQHLDSWRTGRDTKSTYSATRAEGGGCLRDLSHELDLVSYLFGPVERAHAIGGRVGDVTVDSDDAVAFVMRCRNCPVLSLQMNYLDRLMRREWIVNTADITLHADIVQGTLAVNDEVRPISFGPDDAHCSMHEAWLSGHTKDMCTFEEGLALAELIDSVAV